MIALLAAALMVAQDTKETHGKTYEQILAMGYPAWEQFYQAKEGVSTIGMTNTAGLYADALAARNDRLVKRLNAAEKARLGRLRSAMTDFKNEAIGIGVSLTGGGTMWNPITAGMQMDVETALYRILAGLTSKSPSRKVSDVTKVLALLKSSVAKNDIGENWVKVGKESLVGTEKAYAKIVTEAKALPRRDSDTVLEFCRKLLEDVRETGP